MPLPKWTPELISKIREGFLNGHEIKVIASTVQKTPSAVNKALSRYGIRRDSNINIQKKPNAKIPVKQRYAPANKNRPNYFIKRILNTEIDSWVSFKEIQKFLSSKNINVVLIKNDKDLINQEFIMNNKKCSALQVLLAANKIRSEQNLSTLFVEELSW